MGIVRSWYVGVPAKRLAPTIFLVLACSGSAFETGSPPGTDLAGAAGAAGSGSIGTGGSSMLSGAAGAGGDLETAAAGAGGDLETAAGAGGAGGSSAGGVPSCLRGWQGSACDTCTKSPPPTSGETCSQVLACYVEKGSPAGCDFEKPTSDAVVKVAHEVLACRCP